MVSVIIPVYNAQRTIRRCLKSIIDQTFQDIEIVVIDDGSTDDSLNIVERMLQSNDIIVRKPRNEGLEMARRSGITASHGEFVSFVDADDYLEKDAIEKMVNAMHSYDADLVQCGSRVFVTCFGFLEIHPRRSKKGGRVRLLGIDNIKKEYMSFFGCGHFNVTCWGKLYKRDMIENVKTGNLFFGEDLYFNMQIFQRLCSICVIPDTLYHYERQGMTSRFMPDLMNEVKRLYRLKVEKAREMQSDMAFLYSTIELRNCFKVQVESMILHKADTADGIKRWIRRELQDSTYDIFGWLSKQREGGRSPISQAITAKDADTIYRLCRQSVYEWKWKKIARRIMVNLS